MKNKPFLVDANSLSPFNPKVAVKTSYDPHPLFINIYKEVFLKLYLNILPTSRKQSVRTEGRIKI